MVQAEMVDKVSSKVSLVQARNWSVSSAEQSVKIIGLKPATSQQHLIKVPVAWKSQGASQLNGKVLLTLWIATIIISERQINIALINVNDNSHIANHKDNNMRNNIIGCDFENDDRLTMSQSETK